MAVKHHFVENQWINQLTVDRNVGECADGVAEPLLRSEG